MATSATTTESQKEIYSNWSLVKDLWPFLKPYRARLFFSTVSRIIGDMAWLYLAYGLALLVNFLTIYQPGDSLQKVWVIFGLSITAILFRYSGHYVAKMLMFRTGERVALNVQMASIAHLFDLDIAWHEHENTGNKLKKIVRGSDSVDRILRIWIINILQIAINFIGITFIIARFDRTVAWLTLAFLVTYYTLAYFFRKKASRAASIVNVQDENLQGILFEALNNVRSVKVLGMASALKKIIRRESDELFKKILARIFWFTTSGAARSVYAQLFQIGVIVFIVYGVIQGQYQVGFLVLFFGYFNSLQHSVNDLAEVTQDYIIAKLSIGRMFELLKEPVRIDCIDGKVKFPRKWKKISFRDVSFSYGNNPVLHNISFAINRGEKVGIVGLSGAGKSTIFKLLLKEHESYSGEILIDTVPLTSISKQDYFKHSAVVLQDTEVFNFSLRDNVALANMKEEKNKGLFAKAIQVSHVHDFLARLPHGVETLIGEKGVRLSGGERQRVGIARAVFKNPELLLLDEATSHLDIESEEKIRLSLHEFFHNVTAIVIAHRLTTIREMDRIIVVEEGKIIEEGSFEELHVQRGRFFELWEKQRL